VQLMTAWKVLDVVDLVVSNQCQCGRLLGKTRCQNDPLFVK